MAGAETCLDFQPNGTLRKTLIGLSSAERKQIIFPATRTGAGLEVAATIRTPVALQAGDFIF